jgi:hypothetical protein
MSSKPKVVLGDGAKGDIDNPSGEATIQPGLVGTNEKPGRTASEQEAADVKAAEKADKSEKKES